METMARTVRIGALVIMAGVILVGILGCGIDSDDAEQPTGTSPVENISTNTAELEGVTWNLFSWLDEEGIAQTSYGDNISATIEFGADGMYFAQAPVNTIRGPYTADDSGAMTIEDGAMTRISGDEISNAAENDFVANLQRTAGFHIANGMLRLLDSNGNPLMEFEQ